MTPTLTLALTLALLLLAATGCSRSSGAQTSAPSATSPTATHAGRAEQSTAYAPYVSASTAHTTDAAGSPSAYNLAFVVADGDTCTPTWGGHTAIGNATVKSRIAELSSSDSTVRVSFGGATDKELATTCDSAAGLAAAYATALDAAGGATHADFDIEGDTLTDSASVTLRAKAIALLQKERDLDVTFTLPVMPAGLDADSLALLEAANNQGVQVSTVNLMTMNYGESYDGDMGGYAITAAKAAHAQLTKVFGSSAAATWQAMALTSMLGVNDVDGETFTLSDAAQVRAFAEEKSIAWVSAWATFRDVQCEEGTSTDDAATNCSGVTQSAGAYAKAFSG
ncbi:hydrolase [Streptomyces longispororuber]|uniref:hydrolase n=1 Tax=Streptomyces longispororuber TaxID=68230 RepID=UPI00210EA823|nr:hydrolase [Streptomyces longispororuber]MCQ4206563.1 hydrolase [Streptomyces longispororuber]